MDPAPVREDAVRRNLGGNDLATYFRRVDGGRELVVYLPLRPLPPASGIVGLIQLNTPLVDVDRSLAHLRAALIDAALGTVLPSGVLALLFGGYLAAPLESFAAACSAIAREALTRRS